jgi:ATP-dependent RNA circularization protein (DNA/RNA ligase family)
MTATVIKFPTRRVVRNRFYSLEDDSERADLERARRELDRAIKALQRQKLSVGGRLRAAIDKAVAAKYGGGEAQS